MFGKSDLFVDLVWSLKKQSEACGARRVLAVGLMFLCLVAFTPGVARAETVIEGGTTISGDVTWTESGSPYIPNGSLTVAEGATLTLSAGARIYVSPSSGNHIYVDGTLLAQGTADSGVLITRSDSAFPLSWGTPQP